MDSKIKLSKEQKTALHCLSVSQHGWLPIGSATFGTMWQTTAHPESTRISGRTARVLRRKGLLAVIDHLGGPKHLGDGTELRETSRYYVLVEITPAGREMMRSA